MKSKRDKRRIFCLVLMFFWILLMITGCNFMITDTTSTVTALDTPEFSRREELAILKAKPSHTVGVDTLQDMASSILQTKTDSRSIGNGKPAVITEVSKLPSLTDKRFTNSFRNERTLGKIEEEPVELYYFSTENLEEENYGFILMSNDDRIGYVLAIVDNGDLSDVENPFVDILNLKLAEYMEETIAIYADITEKETLAAVEKWQLIDSGARTLTSFWNGDEWVATGRVETDFKKVVDKVIKTNWGQGEPYNAYVDYYQDRNNKLGTKNYIAGCTPVAAAQLIAYHGYISNNNKPGIFTVSARPTIPSSTSVASWNGIYNFTQLTAQPTISANASGSMNEELRGQVAALMHQIGISFKSTYNDGSTGTTDNNASNAFRNVFDYKSDNSGFINATDFSEGTTTWTVTIYNNSRNWVISQLNAKPKARPVLIGGYRIDGTEKKGHSWLIDGHGTMTYYTEYLNKKGSSTLYYSTLTLTNNTVMVHCNLGWNGDSNGWYIYGLFDTGNMAVLDGYTGENNNKRFYSTGITVFTPYR